MDHLIETIDHRVRLWIELLDYGSQEIKITDTENKVEIKLQPHKDRQIVSIPSIEINLRDKGTTFEEMVELALELMDYLSESSLEDFCDFQITLNIDDTKKRIKINFNHYNIKP